MSRLIAALESLISDGLISDSIAIRLRTEFVDDLLATKGQLYSLTYEWEEKMGDDDKSLYSLGLRHAIDKIDDLLDPKVEEVT